MAEPIISKVARKYLNIDGLEFDDLLQIGRIKVWNLIENNNITIDNFKNYARFINTSLTNTYIDQYRKSRAKKRKMLSNALSLDKELSEEDGRTLYDRISVSDQEVSFETLDLIEAQRARTISSKQYFFVE